MTAHDDDQDLVTIRVPRRAAAMYAAELDVAAEPWLVRVTLYGRAIVGLLSISTASVFALVGVLQAVQQDFEDSGLCICATVICASVGSLFLVVGSRQIMAAKRRGLL